METRSDMNGEYRRRRECQDCKWRFTTYEVHSYNLLDDDTIKKQKKDLMKSLVNAEKLLGEIKTKALLIL
jgi:transcriptional regulator NrdR family protein